ncbi:enoyl-CoA hydratase/isomerase family protein [Candidatus Poriferisocius sp.]|uniref:enoyl-CoA hydratase/isomerase family protein n=1 Tax=Candidatus Poriferisocius sp. TaxID=3101276 RepID=UPI003B01768B
MADRYELATIATELGPNRVLIATLNRPDRGNALNQQMHRDLRDLYQRITGDAEVRAVVLTGAGRSFCVGADFAVMEQNLESGYPEGRPDLLDDGIDIARGALRVRQPMVAAVNGHAIGLGASLALFCDVVYLSDAARIGDPHVNTGLVAGDGGAVLWPLLVGLNRAKELLMTGDLLDADHAERFGLVNHVVPPDQVLRSATAMANRLAAGPRHAIEFNKRLCNKELEDRVNRLYDLAFALEAITFDTTDHREAVDAFLNKRVPDFLPKR